MAGYVAATRIERFEIRPGASAVRWRRSLVLPTDPAPAGTSMVELAGTPFGAGVHQRLDDLRTYFGQLTWYLFHEEGWR